MNNVPQRDEQRDKNLIADYLDNMPMHKLGGIYKISSTRIYQILDHYTVPRRTKKGAGPKK